MIVTFFDREDQENPLHGAVIRDSERLFQILEALRGRSPFICELVGENDFLIHIGIGEKGSVQHSRCDGRPPYLLAVAPHQERSVGYTEFLMGGTPCPISNRYCMPFEAVHEIARYFLETGEAHPDFKWENV
jgi:hypothetical protein